MGCKRTGQSVVSRTLTVDLAHGGASFEPTDVHAVGLLLGGRGLNAGRLAAEVDRSVDPLGPHNPLVVSTGMLTGTIAPSATRTHIGARSPLTGGLGSSNIGGGIGPALRSNGVGEVVVRGRAGRPTYLLIEDGEAELRDARCVWGLDTASTVEALRESHGPRAAVLAIGPAGETQRRIACVLASGHAAGRTGMGAVMGAKHLKAIVAVDGGGRSQAGAEARAAAAAYVRRFVAARDFSKISTYGTTAWVRETSDDGMLPTYNFRSGRFAGAAAIDGTNMEQYVSRRHACKRCPVHCKAEVRIAAGRRGSMVGERPDYEPIASWGSRVGVDDPEAVIYLHDVCNRLGIDSISAGGAVAFAIDLYERGIINSCDTGGLRLEWGEVEPMDRLLHDMAAARGLGGLLGNGVRFAAQTIGRGSETYAYHVKGMELPNGDPRGACGLALGYALSTRGADYTSVYANEVEITPAAARALCGDERGGDPLVTFGKAAIIKQAMTVSAVLDALGLCKIPFLTLLNSYSLAGEAELATAVTGIPMTAAELMAAGERILHLERQLNLRCGGSPADDRLPPLFSEEALPGGPGRGSPVDVKEMCDEFYRLMRWATDGRPEAARLLELGLEEAVGSDV